MKIKRHACHYPIAPGLSQEQANTTISGTFFGWQGSYKTNVKDRDDPSKAISTVSGVYFIKSLGAGKPNQGQNDGGTESCVCVGDTCTRYSDDTTQYSGDTRCKSSDYLIAWVTQVVCLSVISASRGG
jgi:hypothetical protein